MPEAAKPEAAKPKAAKPEPSKLTRAHRLALAGLSTIAMVLCCPDFDIWWLAFLAWIPLFAAIEGLRPRAALFYGWLTGCLTVFWGFFWLTELLVKFAGFSKLLGSPVALAFAAYHGLLWGVAMMVTAWVRQRSGRPLWVVAPLAWVALEAVMPNIFPIYMAQAWAWQPLWIQTAELGGVTMVGAIMVAINAGLYTLGRHYLVHRKLDRPAAAFTAALLIATPVYGAIRIAQVETTIAAAPKLKIGVVQGNMSIHEMAQRREKMRIFTGEQEMSAKLQAQGAEIILWGETAYPNGRMFHRASKREPQKGHPWRVHNEELGFTAPVIVGAVNRQDLRIRGCGVEGKCWNTAFLIKSDGTIGATYDKVYRLIFGEYVPIVDPKWYLSKIPSASHLEPGTGAGVLEFEQWRLGPFICYEDILPRYVRQTAQQGVHVFVNLTNDAWFGKTAEPWQHMGLSVFRAVEHRKGMLRSVNTGVSTYIDPTGTVIEKTKLTDPDIDGPQPATGFVADVPMVDPSYRTLYGMTGETFNGLCIFGLVALGWRRRKRAQAS